MFRHRSQDREFFLPIAVLITLRQEFLIEIRKKHLFDIVRAFQFCFVIFFNNETSVDRIDSGQLQDEIND